MAKITIRIMLKEGGAEVRTITLPPNTDRVEASIEFEQGVAPHGSPVTLYQAPPKEA